MKKRILGVMLALCMLVSAGSVAISEPVAAAEATCVSDSDADYITPEEEDDWPYDEVQDPVEPTASEQQLISSFRCAPDNYPNTWVNTKDQALDIVSVAQTQVGNAEDSHGYTKYGEWYGAQIGKSWYRAAAWCAIFISWCANQADIPTSTIALNCVASGYSVSNMKTNQFGVTNTYKFGATTPKPGDIVYISNRGDSNVSNHVGLIEYVDESYIHTIEGNFSDAVTRVTYSLSTGHRIKDGQSTTTRIVFIARPNYTDNSVKEPAVPEYCIYQAPEADADQTSQESSDDDTSDAQTSDSDTSDTDNKDDGNSDTGSTDAVDTDADKTDTGTTNTDTTDTGTTSTDTTDTGTTGTDSTATDTTGTDTTDTGTTDTDTTDTGTTGTDTTDTGTTGTDTTDTGTTGTDSTGTDTTDTDTEDPVYSPLTIWSEPDYSSSQVGTVTGGSSIEVTRIHENWGYTSSCAVAGWVCLDDYTLISFGIDTTTDNASGLCKAVDGNQYYYKNEKIDTTFTGMAKASGTWWYVSKGKINLSYTGMAKNAYGWWYMTKGKLDLTYTGMAKNAYGWWYMTKGKLNLNYTGMAKNAYGWWYITKGKLNTTYTGMAENAYGWWYFYKGKLNRTFTGIAKNAYGYWYFRKGRIAFTYSGKVKYGKVYYRVTNGKAKRL